MSEKDIIRKHHRFVRDDEKDYENKDDWEIRMSRSYYDLLFKE